MVSFTQITASAVLAFCASVSAAPQKLPVRDETQSFTHPIGMLVNPRAAGANVDGPAVVASHTVVDPATLGNATVVEPSANLAAAAAAVAERAVADTRMLYDNTNYPYTAMGRLIWSNGIYCSAALVGNRVVSAARHCVPMNGEQVTLTFQPDFYNSERFPSAQIVGFYYLDPPATGSCQTSDDWALFILDHGLGGTQGYLGAKIIDTTNEVGKPIFNTFGYPGDLAGGARPYRTTNFAVTNPSGCETGTPLDANVYVAGGQSGSPLFRLDDNGVYNYGALSVQVSDSTGPIAGIWAGGASFVNTIVTARNAFP